MIAENAMLYDQQRELYNLARDYGVRMEFRSMGLQGCFKPPVTMVLNRIILEDRQRILSVFFHELGHVYCYRHDLWYNYHRDVTHITGLKAERWVERWAAIEMGKRYPDLTYQSVYFKPKVVINFKKRIQWLKNSKKSYEIT